MTKEERQDFKDWADYLRRYEGHVVQCDMRDLQCCITLDEYIDKFQPAIDKLISSGQLFCERYNIHFEDDKGVCLTCNTTAAERERKAAV